MATIKNKGRSSLAVLPKNYVIVAKRISQGGDLLLVKQPPNVAVECQSDRRRGRVCVMGPLAEFIRIKGAMRFESGNCPPKDGQKDVGVFKSIRPSAAFLYQNYKLDITSLQSKSEKREKPKHEPQSKEDPVPKEESQVKEKPVPEEEPEPKADTRPNEKSRTTVEEPDQGKAKVKAPEPIKRSLSEELDAYRMKLLRQKARFSSLLPAQLSNVSPFSVLVKWKQNPSIPCYSMMSVFELLSKYGTIVSMGQLAINSCLVLFENFHAAVKVVRDSLIGPRAYPLICKWYYPLMYMESVRLLDIHPYKKPKKVSEEAKFLRQFHDMQEAILTCLKGRGSALTYDRAAFNP